MSDTLVHKNWSPYPQKQEQPILFSTNFAKQIPLLHENIPDNVLRPIIKEFTIVLDSIDRDVEKYPNPFEYTVNIGPLVQQRITEYLRDSKGDVIRDGITGNFLTTDVIVPTPGPIIKNQISWLKYIRVIQGILPRSHGAIELDKDRNTQVHIKELTGQIGPYKFSTNDELSDTAAILSDYNILNENFFLALNAGSAVYYDETIRELKRLTISFKDSFGKQLSYPYLKSCACCNKKCTNTCCMPENKNNISVTYGGSFAIDLKPLIQVCYSLDTIINLETHCLVSKDWELKYEECKDEIILRGTFMDRALHLTINTTNYEYCGTWDNQKITGTMKLTYDSCSITGMTKFAYGVQQVYIQFSIPYCIADNQITIKTNVFVTIYPLSIIEPMRVSIPCLDSRTLNIECEIGDMRLIGTYDKKEMILNTKLTGYVFNTYINLAIHVKNNVGSVVGTFGSQDISLVISFNSDVGTIQIYGKFGNDVVNVFYMSPTGEITIHNIKQLYGFFSDKLDINHIIPVCINLENMSNGLVPNNVMNMVMTNNVIDIRQELYNIDGVCNKYVGSYNYNNVIRYPSTLTKMANAIYMDCINNPNISVVINHITGPAPIRKVNVFGKIYQKSGIEYDIDGQVGNIKLIDGSTEYNLQGTVESNVISLSDNKNGISFGMLSNYSKTKIDKKCCECVVSPKDRRLQNQLHVRIGIDVSNIPQLFNKQQ